MVCARFHNSGSDRPNTDSGSKLYTDTSVGVTIFQIMNKLRNVLDGIYIMVWRWANEADARC